VWHASVSGRYSRDWHLFEEIARDELESVGDATLGEWLERGDIALHLRRRLTDGECRKGQIATVVDVRGTDEGKVRIDRMRPFLPSQIASVSAEQLP